MIFFIYLLFNAFVNVLNILHINEYTNIHKNLQQGQTSVQQDRNIAQQDRNIAQQHRNIAQQHKNID